MTQLTDLAPLTGRRARRFTERYGPWAVITGASSGLGRETAEELAALGLGVVLVARRTRPLEAVAAALRAEVDTPVLVVPADLATDQGVGDVLAAISALDVGLVVAAAGVGTAGPFIGADPGHELAMLDVNCRAVLALTLNLAPRLAARGRGGLVLMASLVGRQGAPWAASYGATKAYVQTLGDGLRVELRPRGVDVLVSAPGPVHSAFADRAGMRMGAALRPEQVVRPTLRALGHQGSVTPGALSKLLTWSLAPLPRGTRTHVMGRVMRRMAAPSMPQGSQNGRRRPSLNEDTVCTNVMMGTI